ncbi:hypothetical protein B7453_12775 [Pseudomonas sp. IB20]|nr:hypothetical protein B7453_12775 [Pseudomonas sp. IB20]
MGGMGEVAKMGTEIAKVAGEVVKALAKQQGGENKDGANQHKIANEDTHKHNGKMQYDAPQSMNININQHS